MNHGNRTSWSNELFRLPVKEAAGYTEAMSVTLSSSEARRLAVASQGFGERLSAPSVAHLRKLADGLHAFQIDSVNVLVRAHYVPAFARLGPYPTEALDSLAYRNRELFEYWGHEACLMPISLYPLVRYRMQKHAGADSGVHAI